jgi:ribosome recycling factor
MKSGKYYQVKTHAKSVSLLKKIQISIYGQNAKIDF